MFSKGLLKQHCKLSGARTRLLFLAQITKQDDLCLWQLGTHIRNYKNIIPLKHINNGWFWSQCSETVLSLTVLLSAYCSVTVPYYTYSPTQHFNFITAIMSMAQGILMDLYSALSQLQCCCGRCSNTSLKYQLQLFVDSERFVWYRGKHLIMRPTPWTPYAR